MDPVQRSIARKQRSIRKSSTRRTKRSQHPSWLWGQKPALYRWYEDIETFFPYCRNTTLIRVNGHNIRHKITFCDALGQAMGFEHPHLDWSSVEEGLRDFSWMDNKPRVIVYENFAPFALTDVREFETALDNLETAVAYWRKHLPPLYAIIHDPSYPQFPIRRLSSEWIEQPDS